MKVHLIVAHSEQKSFNHALHQSALAYFAQQGIDTLQSDLHEMKFESAASAADTPSFQYEQSDGLFQLGKAQKWALQHDGFAPSIRAEQAKLMAADVVILQFPLLWGSFPAILKGWIDRVLSAGFAYAQDPTMPDKVLKPKKVLYSVTTGGAENDEERQYYNQKIDQLYKDVFGYLGWQCLPVFFAHGVQYESLAARRQLLEDYKGHLKAVVG